jgi:Cu(I)/Ag(I) efflux system membrane fusion protein
VPVQREPRQIERVVVAPQFQAELSRVWDQYLAVQQALAADDFEKAQKAIAGLESAVTTVDTESLKGSAAEHLWHKEHANLTKLVRKLKQAGDIKAMREDFRPLSEEVGVLAKAFGFGEDNAIYELQCPMAFEGQGAIWYQADDDVRNPYYGATMLKCADRVERVVHDEPAAGEKQSHDDHSQH